MFSHRIRISSVVSSLGLVALLGAAGCGNVTIDAEDTQITDDLGGNGGDTSGGTDTVGVDTAGDAAGDECITDFDCNGIKGRTPCNLPFCDNGFCKLKNRDEGSTCKDPSMTLTACQTATCNAAGTCVATAVEKGTPCIGTAPTGDCEVSACDDKGACSALPKADGEVCGLGACGNKCDAGKCVVADAGDYDDGNPCTKDYCDQGSVVVHEPITDLSLDCEDGDACTKNDFCLEGKCSGTLDTCNDGKPCTIDLCNKETGCVHTPDNAKCTTDDPCIQLACDLAVGCTATGANPGTSCDDGDSCTTGDVCDKDGGCAGPTNSCTCETDNDCDQSDLCRPRICDSASKACVIDPAKAIVCDDGADGFCGKNTCDAKTGTCAMVAQNEGKDCDDNDICTSKSGCKEAYCTGAVDKDCDDSNPCTTDACDPIGGCQHSPGGAGCDDDNPCTENDFCQNGGCVGSPKGCDDGVPCTFDACDPASGKCTNEPKDADCDDGNPCTTDVCDATGSKGCKSTPDDAAKCEDDDECTLSGCKSGQCVVTGIDKTKPGCGCQKDAECDDKNLCTSDSCKDGNCVFDPAPQQGKTCDTGNLCQVADSGSCKDGACAGGKPKDCSGEEGPCNDAACNPKTGSCDKSTKADGSACEADESLCTQGDTCKGGICEPGTPVDCSDKGDACNLAACDAKTGQCTVTAQAKGTLCDDGIYCTDNDTCDGAGKCTSGAARDCSASGDACNNAICDEAAGKCGAMPKAAGAACDDGQFCTVDETCDGKGSCSGGKDKVCDNGGDACLVASCDPVKGACVTAPGPKDVPCNDGNACTLSDLCDGTGKCVGGDPKSCTGDACNDGVCTPKTGACGLAPKAKGVSCNDGNACTQTDTCDGAGKCAGGNPKTCAGDACNDGVCAPATGACDKQPKKDTTPCNDGNACTTGDACYTGVCKGGAYVCDCASAGDCDDKNPCTKDACVNVSGKLTCQNTVQSGLACNDGNTCTTADACNSSGICVGKTVVCDDSNPCTADACVAGKCTTSPHKAGYPCSDGNACTNSDSCNGKGSCIGAALVCNDGKVCTNDICDSKTGKCLFINNTAACSDGNACTLNDVCASGLCKPGTAKVCTDGTVCTTDGCNPKTGTCSFAATNENAACESGSYSYCGGGKCLCRVYIADSGGPGTDSFNDLVHHSDGGTISVGSYYYNSTYSYDGYIQRRNKSGAVMWSSKIFQTSGAMAEYLHGVTNDGTTANYIAVGQAATPSNGDDGWVVWFTDTGAIKKKFLLAVGTKNDVLRDVVKDTATTVYAAGNSYSLNTLNSSYNSAWLTKIDVANGKALWSKARIGVKSTSGFPPTFKFYHYAAYGIARAGSYLFTAGYTNEPGFGGNDGNIIKWDLNGGIVAQKTYGTAGNDAFYGIAAYGTSYLWVAGAVTNGSKGQDGWLHKSNQSNLSQVYDKRYGTTSTDEFRAVTNYGSGAIAVGRSLDAAVSRYRPWMVRTSSTGNISSDVRYDSNAQPRYLFGVSYNGYIATCGQTYTGSNWNAYNVSSSYTGVTTCK
ncbi:MAG: hypothetical protein RIT45_2742 [Pseudomonadota bacterium]|jgi:hypothetical protein